MNRAGRFCPVLLSDKTLKKFSYGSRTTDYIYNLAQLLTEVNNANGSTQISKYSYTYYVDGNQKSKTESVAGTNKGTTNYTYDGLNNLLRNRHLTRLTAISMTATETEVSLV